MIVEIYSTSIPNTQNPKRTKENMVLSRSNIIIRSKKTDFAVNNQLTCPTNMWSFELSRKHYM